MLTLPADAVSGKERGVKRLFDWRTLFFLTVCACLAFTFYSLLYSAFVYSIPRVIFLPLAFLFLGLLIWQDRILRNFDMALLLALFLWINIACIANFNRVDDPFSASFFSLTCMLFFLVYPLAYVMPRTYGVKPLRVILYAFVALLSVLVLYGLILTVMNRSVNAPGKAEGALGIWKKLGRFCIFAHPNPSGTLCVTGLSACLFLWLGAKKKAARVALLFGFLTLYAALALTDSRAAQLAFFPTFAIFLFLSLRFQRIRSAALAVLLKCGVTLVACAILYLGFGAAVAAFNYARQAAAPNAAAAQTAESYRFLSASPDQVADRSGEDTPETETPPADIVDRGFGDALSFNGRTTIWKDTLKEFSADRFSILFGALPVSSYYRFIPGFKTDNAPAAFHSTYLEILFSFGAPGLLLFCTFLVFLFARSLRLLFCKRDNIPVQARFLPAVLIPFVVMALFEDSTFIESWPIFVPLFFYLFAGYVVVLSRVYGKSAPNERNERSVSK